MPKKSSASTLRVFRNTSVFISSRKAFMGRFAFGRSLILTVLGLGGCILFTACGSGTSTQVVTNEVPAVVNLAPRPDVSLEVGKFLNFTAAAQNSAGNAIRETFSYQSSAPNIVTVSSGGIACAGTWDSLTAPSVCTPGSTGVAQITAVARGVPSAPVTVYVHQHVTSVVISKLPNQPPTLSTSCLSKRAPSGNPESTMYQAFAFNGSTDITSSVGPFTWQSALPSGQTSTTSSATSPVVLSSPSVTAPLNQQIATAGNPGSGFIFASVGNVNSQPLPFTTCPVQSIILSVLNAGASPITLSSGTSATVNATVTDGVGMPLIGVPLTWSTSNPISVGVTGGTSTSFGSIGSVTAPGVGSAAVTASCTPPSCNSGITPSMPIYPQQAIEFLVRPASGTTTPASPTVYVTSTGCKAATSTCITQIVPITRSSSTSAFAAGTPAPMPFVPNSALFDRTGGNEYFGVDSTAFGTKGALVVTGGSSVSGIQNVAGKVLAVSPDGTTVIFSDTTDSPQRVFICANCNGSSRTSTPILVSGAVAAEFSPDNLKAYIVSGSACPGTASAGCLVVYSKIDAIQNIPLAAPATSVAFIGDGILGYIAGGSPSGGAFLPTCGPNTAAALGAVNLTGNMLLPLPDGQSVLSLSAPNLETVTATVSGLPLPMGALGCPAPRGSLNITNTVNSAGSLGTGSFTPSQFFLSSDGSKAYILGAPSLGFVIQFDLATQTPLDISLAGNATPLSASLSPAGDLLFVGANDGTVHVINTTTLADTEQVTFPFPQNSMCVGPGTPATPVETTLNITDATQTGANTTYSYTVDAFDAAGNTSAKSSAASVTTPTGGGGGGNGPCGTVATSTSPYRQLFRGERQRSCGQQPERQRNFRNDLRTGSGRGKAVEADFRTSLCGPKRRTSFNHKRIYAFVPASISLPMLSRTPLMNCADSGEENLRAISMASLMTTARGVCGNPSSSATAARIRLRSTAAMRSMRQFSA